MLPQHVVLIDAVPLLPNGKMDRHALPAPDRSADTTRERPLAAHEQPHTAAEQAVATIWQALLGLGPIARSDNFFDLGGHSLLAMRAVGEMERQAGVRVELRRLVHESLAQIAATPAQVAAPHAAPAAQPAAQPAEPGNLKRLIRSVRELIGG